MRCAATNASSVGLWPTGPRSEAEEGTAAGYRPLCLERGRMPPTPKSATVSRHGGQSILAYTVGLHKAFVYTRYVSGADSKEKITVELCGCF